MTVLKVAQHFYFVKCRTLQRFTKPFTIKTMSINLPTVEFNTTQRKLLSELAKDIAKAFFLASVGSTVVAPHSFEIVLTAVSLNAILGIGLVYFSLLLLEGVRE
jgi:hypothetical protein